MNAADLIGIRSNLALRARLAPVRPELVKVRQFPRWLDRVWPRWVGAVTMPWGIYIRGGRHVSGTDEMSSLIVHELVHVQQWRSLGWVGFLRRYIGDYLRGRIRLLDHRNAYLAISLEVEARRVAAETAGRE